MTTEKQPAVARQAAVLRRPHAVSHARQNLKPLLLRSTAPKRSAQPTSGKSLWSVGEAVPAYVSSLQALLVPSLAPPPVPPLVPLLVPPLVTPLMPPLVPPLRPPLRPQVPARWREPAAPVS